MNDTLFQFAQQRIDVVFTCQPDHDIELFDLHIQWIIVLAKENPHLVRQNIGSLLQQ